MNKSKLSLTVFFMLLTISIGLVSVNLPFTAKAQNSALSQNGVGAAEQETKQDQSSTQDNQIISGDSSILSGNNLLCQSMEDSNVVSSLCSPDGLSEPPPTSPIQDRAPLHITVTTTTTPLCGTGSTPCPVYWVIINVLDDNRRNLNAVASLIYGNELLTVDAPIGVYELYIQPYRSLLWDFPPQITYSGDCVQSQSDPKFCKGTMSEQGGHVKINFHFNEEER